MWLMANEYYDQDVSTRVEHIFHSESRSKGYKLITIEDMQSKLFYNILANPVNKKMNEKTLQCQH
jgi:hypothetical protein